MKHLFTILFLSFFSVCFSQQKTEIYIIGNIHDSVPNYHPQILFEILDKIKPDLLLHEVDNEGMKDYVGQKNIKGNENLASKLYIKKYPNTLRFPFDFEGRNQYRKDKGMVPTDNLTVNLIDSLCKVKQLKPSEIKIYEQFDGLTKELMKLAEMSPENFNNSKTDIICEKRQNCQYHELLKIVEKRPEFSNRFVTKPNGEKISYKEGYKLMSDFWDLRNRTMALNIYKIAEKSQGKKMVVLTGFLHRYYLIQQLNKLNKGNYIIKEFYQ